MEPYDCVIIGGGPAGMMAAIVMARRGLRVLIVEKNKLLGRKLRITGKGRCNLTNDCDFDTLISNICQGGKFLYSALRRFSNQDLIGFFHENGLETVTERGGRVFPASQKAYDVAETLCGLLRTLKVPVFYESTVKELCLNAEQTAVCGVRVLCGGKMREIGAKNVLVATGGFTYPKTGSTGDGYRFAKKAGHSITEPRPSLVGLQCREKALCASLQGLSLKNVSIGLQKAGRTVFEDFGEMVFTETGVSGPIVLSASRHFETDGNPYTLRIDLKPALDDKTLDARILSDFAKYEKKHFQNALHDLLPQRMISVVIEKSGIAPHAKVSEITREQRRRLADVLKHFTLTPVATESADQAIVTAGGVTLSEINPKTMGSKCCSGLYFAGEVLDADAYTGGFNLTIAFSTGYCAGSSILA